MGRYFELHCFSWVFLMIQLPHHFCCYKTPNACYSRMQVFLKACCSAQAKPLPPNHGVSILQHSYAIKFQVFPASRNVHNIPYHKESIKLGIATCKRT